MRRVIVRSLVTLWLFVLASPASAQSNVSAGWAGTKASSTHGDEVRVAIALGLWSAGHLDLRPAAAVAPARQAPATKKSMSLVADVRFGHEWGGGSISQFLGGLRYTSDTLMKWPCYVEVTGGAVHFTSATNGVFHAAVGMMIPWGGPRRAFYVQGGFPVIFFSGNTEVGVEGSAGITFAIGK